MKKVASVCAYACACVREREEMEEERQKGGPPSHDAPTFLPVTPPPTSMYTDSSGRRGAQKSQVLRHCRSEEDGRPNAALKSLVLSDFFSTFFPEVCPQGHKEEDSPCR